ncbi:hypothetical protein Q9292_02445 [Methylophilus sp. VKM B-3414]|uniref:hypothetical protein n=1 Tax=Methylophilus sp. VKM B-3414 TaxID=3076121 RepID=UPI0028C5B070|nr:hypothetical protein [Methylophilus sp. VKM B-3414]MDT7848458.1 hypothetical protein [Methylophilus sp. VKM B-3414]
MSNFRDAVSRMHAIIQFSVLLISPLSGAAADQSEIKKCANNQHEVMEPCIEARDTIFQSEPEEKSQEAPKEPSILKEMPKVDDIQVPSTVNSKSQILKYFSNEPWSKKKELPSIGLALSGGGSKSAPFVMGVMKRFAENDWMAKTDIISSVSGGGYSAYYYYKKMWMIKYEPEFMKEYRTLEDYKKGVKSLPSTREIFVDIRKEKYGEVLGNKACESNTETNLTRCNVITDDYKTYGNLTRANSSCNKFELNSTRHQDYIECYQDVLSVTPGGTSNTDSSYPVPAFVGMLLTTIASLPFHHIANSLFDWKVPLSPTQFTYKRGIKRTYGNTPDDKSNNLLKDLIPTTDKFDFKGLMGLYEECEGCGKLPWWIINMTNSVYEDDKKSINKTVFELTANSMGSGNYGYVFGKNFSDLIPGFRPIDAVAASGAFFDTLSAYFPYAVSGKVVFLIMHGLNLRWGIEIPNYLVSNRVRTLHSLIPWPIYYKFNFDRKPDSAYIRLADGGQSGENLGIYSLLRRGTRNIVIADGAWDINGDRKYSELPELCLTNQFLNRHGLEMVFVGYPNRLPSQEGDKELIRLSKVCSDDEKLGPRIKGEPLKDFSPYEWKRAIWVGQIQTIENKILPKAYESLDKVKLFYIKSAIDYKLVATELMNIQANPTLCDGEDDNPQGVVTKNEIPCTMLGYIIDSGNYQTSDSKVVEMKIPNGNSVWPQTNTVKDTANSSANKYKAYRDLGWYAARKLSCLMDDDGISKEIVKLDVCMNYSKYANNSMQAAASY